MKVILYTGLTLNGLIAKEDGNTDWISGADFDYFNSACRQAGAAIFGRKTWEEMNPDWLPFPEGQGWYVVLTRNKSLQGRNPKTIFTDRSAQEIVDLIKSKGVSEVIIGGGGEAYGYFLKSKIVDEVIIDFAPYVFGKGIPFVSNSDFEQEFELVETSKLTDQIIQLRYKVVK